MGKLQKGRSKKPYSSPKLTNYGTIRDLTQKVGHRGNPDANPRRSTLKTHF